MAGSLMDSGAEFEVVAVNRLDDHQTLDSVEVPNSAYPQRGARFGPSASSEAFGNLSAKQLDLHNRLSNSTDLGGIPLQTGEVGFGDISALTKATGWEHGVVRMNDGSRLLVRGNSRGIPQLPDMDVKRIVVHSHPGDQIYHMQPSGVQGDLGYLWSIGQKRSYIVTSGANRSGYDYWLGTFNNEGYWRGVNTPIDAFAQGVANGL